MIKRLSTPARIIHARAPIRICDLGGWTDTWFAKHGQVLNVAVLPYVEVNIAVSPRGNDSPVTLHVEDYGDHYSFDPRTDSWERHPLLEAAITRAGIPDEIACEISIHSEAPAGGSTGTSAAVTVALLGALDCLMPGRMTPHEIAYAAHAVETEMLGLQSGIQDQLCAAYGGINFIEITDFPQAKVTQLSLPDALLSELEQRLSLIYLGKSHSSSKVHENVITDLEHAGPDNPQLESLRHAAQAGRDALAADDLAAFGRAMVENTAAQEELHPELVNPDARKVIEIARAHGALGWKVNGAGGEGGSLTLLSGPRPGEARAMLAEIRQELPASRAIPIRLSRAGLHCWETTHL